jgi:hypothetical protein
MKFPGSIKVRIEVPGQSAWYATSLQHKSTPERTVVYLNQLALRQGTGATYALATQAEYDTYKGR